MTGLYNWDGVCLLRGTSWVLKVILVNEWHCDRVFSQYFSFPLSVSFSQCSISIFIYMLLLPEGQTGEAWEPPKQQFAFGNRVALASKVGLLSPFAPNLLRVALWQSPKECLSITSQVFDTAAVAPFGSHTNIPSSDLGSAEPDCEQVTSAVQKLADSVMRMSRGTWRCRWRIDTQWSYRQLVWRCWNTHDAFGQRDRRRVLSNSPVSFVMSVCLSSHVKTRETLNEIWWNLVVMTFTKVCRNFIIFFAS
jgi:hypothetical protein